MYSIWIKLTFESVRVTIDEKVAATDKCIEIGNISPLKGLVSPEKMPELEKRLEKVKP